MNLHTYIETLYPSNPSWFFKAGPGIWKLLRHSATRSAPVTTVLRHFYRLEHVGAMTPHPMFERDSSTLPRTGDTVHALVQVGHPDLCCGRCPYLASPWEHLPLPKASMPPTAGTVQPGGKCETPQSHLPPLVVIQVGEEHVLGNGLSQRRHGLIVLGNDLWRRPGSDLSALGTEPAS